MLCIYCIVRKYEEINDIVMCNTSWQVWSVQSEMDIEMYCEAGVCYPVLDSGSTVDR